MTGIAWDADRGGPDRRVDDDRHDRGEPALAAAYPGIAAAASGLATPADPAPGDARRQSRAAFAVLVLPQSAYRLSEEGRD